MSDKPPPHSRDAEDSLLGCLLRHPDDFDTARGIVTADQLYFDATQKVFRAIEGLRAAGHPVEPLTVFEVLRDRKEADDVGGAKAIKLLWDAAPATGATSYYAQRVRGFALRRGLIHAANETIRDAADGADGPDELAAAAEQRFLRVADGMPGGAEAVASDELLLSRLHAIDDRIGGKRDGFPSGLVDLDGMIGGFEPGELVVVGARPSRGKSALGLTFASNASDQGIPSLFISLEMSAGQLGDRLLAMRSGVGMSLFTRGVMRGAVMSDDQLALLAGAARRRPGQAPIYFDDKPGRTAAEILSAGRRAVRRRKVGLIVVDYLQMIRSANPRDNREQQVADISRNLKVMARTCGVPVVCLAQLNRESEKEKRRPRMSDLRESGAIEQDTDKGILIHDPEPPDGERPVERKVELIVDKQRNGPTGVVEVWYAAHVMRFENAAKGPGAW